ncbi:hypothetical protein T265_03953 [Opisthorchis viverrini]|uniref:Uncharacterized protein n=1 Tax=Opisthorchis viverrini TaxID=6198 RepID=A0A075AH56_OPIVI|nr:hypothetical protein T265_03953 [Opisthorchis viverrini]KER29379.1 hypothetical protein T265_03953 [Opisthorchis viverrini]
MGQQIALRLKLGTSGDRIKGLTSVLELAVTSPMTMQLLALGDLSMLWQRVTCLTFALESQSAFGVRGYRTTIGLPHQRH